METKVSLNTTCKILLNFNRGFSAHGQNWSFFQLSLFTHSWNPSKNEGEGKNTPPQICTILISETDFIFTPITHQLSSSLSPNNYVLRYTYFLQT